jgi:hypothetical protein
MGKPRTKLPLCLKTLVSGANKKIYRKKAFEFGQAATKSRRRAIGTRRNEGV